MSKMKTLCELEQLADSIDRLKARRERLVKKAASEGASTREIGNAARLSNTTAWKMVQPDCPTP